jgi:hypothetical protein
MDVAGTGGKRVAYRVLVGKPEGNNLGDLGVDMRIILRWIFGYSRRGIGTYN